VLFLSFEKLVLVLNNDLVKFAMGFDGGGAHLIASAGLGIDGKGQISQPSRLLAA
jgi:hypothetical protein